MHGIEATYHCLATTPNQAAIAVLGIGLQSDLQSTRGLALRTLAQRSEPEAADLVLDHWGALTQDDHRELSGHKEVISAAAGRCFENKRNLSAAISACRSLRLFNQVDAIATMAETAADKDVRDMAVKALIDLAMPLGQAARQDRPISTTRGPFLARLIESVRRYPIHRNDGLIDAFMIASTWSDSALRTWIVSEKTIGSLIRSRLLQSSEPGVIHLIAGYLRRRNLPPCVAEAIRSRNENVMGDAILRAVGDAPVPVTRGHLAKIGVPASLAGGIQRCRDVIPGCRAAMVHVYSCAGDSPEAILPVALMAIRHWKQPDVTAAVALALSRCPLPSVDWSMRAAVPVAKLLDDDAKRRGVGVEADPPTLESLGIDSLRQSDSVMVARLIDLLRHEDPAVAKNARRLLTPLHAESMLSRFEELRGRSRRRLGRVVMRIDPEAVGRVRDALRHPVLERRIEAIACADALAAVELLSDSFVHIAREDHQEARIRAAEAMGSATDEVTYELLREMMQLPESQVRDAAEYALSTRRGSDAVSPAPTQASPAPTPTSPASAQTSSSNQVTS